MPVPLHAPSSGDFHTELKSATDLRHRELEQLDISRQLAGGTISPHNYRQYLLAMQDFVGSVEQKTGPLLQKIIPDFDARQKMGWLAEDLQLCSAHRPLFDDTPWTEGFALGVFYVLEGSTLGGRFIQAKLKESGKIPAEKMRFFEGYGNRSGMMWKQFLAAMASFADTGEKRAQLTAGANFGFATIKEQLTQISP